MVLEAILNPVEAEKRPWQMFFLGMLFSVIGIFFSYIIFRDQASLVAVFLIVLASIPIIYNTIKLEELKDEKTKLPEGKLLREHAKALSVFMFLFFGIMVSFALAYVFLPQDFVNSLFSLQTTTIEQINSNVVGNFFLVGATGFDMFIAVFLNNLWVMALCVLFAFLYGVGAIFILTWNATVIGVAIGSFVRGNIGEVMASIGFVNAGHYFGIFSLGLLRYLIHGVFEILAYFVAGLAGGIISISIIRHAIEKHKFKRVLIDASGLLLIAVTLLVFAAFIEIFINPILF
jgi:uncharacterized membrane protein SpoIIM required for sporulation